MCVDSFYILFPLHITAQTVGSCNIGSDNIDDVVNWRCTAYVAGVSIVCLVDNIRLEDCLCKHLSLSLRPLPSFPPPSLPPSLLLSLSFSFPSYPPVYSTLVHCKSNELECVIPCNFHCSIIAPLASSKMQVSLNQRSTLKDTQRVITLSPSY